MSILYAHTSIYTYMFIYMHMLSIDMLYIFFIAFLHLPIYIQIYTYICTYIHTYIQIFVHAHIYTQYIYIYLQKGTPQLPWQHVGDDQRKWKEPLHVSKRDCCESELWDQIAPALNMLCSCVLPGQVWWVSIIFMWCCIHPWCLLAHGWCKIAIRYPHFFFSKYCSHPPNPLMVVLVPAEWRVVVPRGVLYTCGEPRVFPHRPDGWRSGHSAWWRLAE
jgi:hypothetical protein